MISNCSVIILTKNEERNLQNSLPILADNFKDIYIIDSGSTDRTEEIASSFKCTFLYNEFINQSVQINWAMANISFESEWILRVDADEIWTQEGINKLQELLKEDYEGISVKMLIHYMGKPLFFGGQRGNNFVRVWKKQSYVETSSWMDEHAQINGKVFISKIQVLEMNYDRMQSLSMWTLKHNLYSIREAISILSAERDGLRNDFDNSLIVIRVKKYLKQIMISRHTGPFLLLILFLYRYIILLGFLDGARGFSYTFLQSFWYRYLSVLKARQYYKLGNGNLDEAICLANTEYREILRN